MEYGRIIDVAKNNSQVFRMMIICFQNVCSPSISSLACNLSNALIHVFFLQFMR